MSVSSRGYIQGQYRYRVMLAQGEKACRRVDCCDHHGRLVYRVWSYETDGGTDQLMYSNTQGADLRLITASEFC